MKTELLTIFTTVGQYACRTMAVTQTYDALREAIVRGEIAPGARLVESDISTAFEMSRGAVRTALIRLEQDGLVVRQPHRGARVRRVSTTKRSRSCRRAPPSRGSPSTRSPSASTRRAPPVSWHV